MNGDVEFFGQPRLHPPAEACWSFAAAFGITEDEARERLEDGTAAGLIEQRTYACTSCGGGLMYQSERCRCGRAKPGDSVRLKPLPHQCLDPLEAGAQLRRRYYVPL